MRARLVGIAGLRAREERLTAGSAVGAAGRAGGPPASPATGPGSDYAQLSRMVKRAGLLRRRPVYYSLKIGLNLVLLAAGWTVFAVLGRSWWQMLVAVFLAVMFTQTGFIGHHAAAACSPTSPLAGLTTRLSITCSRPCRGRICVTPKRPCGRSAPSAAFPTRRQACWPPIGRYCAISAPLARQPTRNRPPTQPPQIQMRP